MTGPDPQDPQDPYGPPPSGGAQPAGQYGAQPYGSQQYGSQQYGDQAQGGQYGGQPYGGQPYGAPPARRNGFGVAALVLGILALLGSVTVVFGLLFGLAAIVFGVLGRGRAKRGEADNGGMALAGLVLGVVSLLASVAILLIAGSLLGNLLNSPEAQRLQQCLSAAGNDQARQQACQDQFQRDLQQR